MTSSGGNPHKKGEHVFNDIAGSLENAITSAVGTDSARSLVLADRYGRLELHLFPQTIGCIDRFRTDSILAEARTVVAPATGIHDDINSKTYGAAAAALKDLLSEIVVATSALAWRKLPHSNSSFREFDAIAISVGKRGGLKAAAVGAIDVLIRSAHDPSAEESALSERVSDTELDRRRAAIDSMKQHRSALEQKGHTLVTTFMEELEEIVDRRIGAA